MKGKFLFQKLFVVMAIFSMTALVSSCTEEETEDLGVPTLSVSTNTLVFDSEGNSTDGLGGTIEVESNRDWAATVPATWLTLSQTSGSGDATITMSMSETGISRSTTISITTYNSYGTLAQEEITVTQVGSGEDVNKTITFDGSELPSYYTTDQTVTVEDAVFTINQVANFSGGYDVDGPIQFKSGEGYMYNTIAIEGISYIAITLANDYNNFTLYSGTSANPKSNIVTGTEVEGVCTYILPEDDTFISIYNEASYTAYATSIEIVCGEGSTPISAMSLTLDSDTAAGLPTSAGTSDETVAIGDAAFVINSTYWNSYYSSMQSNAGGYWYNVSEFYDLVQVVIEEDYSYYNYSLYAGTSAGSMDTKISYTKSGIYYTYLIPEGYNFVTIINESTYTAYADKVTFYFDSIDGNVEVPEIPETPDEPEYEVEGDVVINGESGLPTSSETTTLVLEGATFIAENTAWSDYYGNMTVASGNSIYNTTELIGLSSVIVDEDGSYYNFTLYVGTEVNPMETEISYTKNGNYYIYEIPEGYTFFTVYNGSNYGAYASAVYVNYDSLGETVTVETPEVEEPEVEEPEEDAIDKSEAFIYFDGSELPTSYGSDETLEIDGVSFIINQVANFTTVYETSTGPIQFKSSVSYMYNTVAIEDLATIKVLLSNGYNNFTIYSGTEQNPTTTALEYTTDGDVCTYEVPAGDTFVTISNVGTYTAYADVIAFFTSAE